MNKNQIMIDYLLQCPTIQKNPLFFNFGKAGEDNNRVMILPTDSKLSKPFIDGSIEKAYKFTIITNKSISYNPVVKQSNYPDENLTEMTEFQEVIDWIQEQEDIKNRPDFGEDCQVDRIFTLTDNPVFLGIDSSVTPALATYSITIQVDYVDYTYAQWRN